MKQYLTFFSLSFVVGFILLGILTNKRLKSSFLRNNKNKSVLGGVSLFFSFMLIFLFFSKYRNGIIPDSLMHILILSSAVWIFGFLDDLRELSLFTKIFLQVLIVAVFLIKGKKVDIYYFPYWINYIISFLWIVGVTNVFNLLDIGDGLCGGVSFIVGVSFFIISIASGNYILAGLFASLCGALLSFLFFNLPPARILMGNAGSHFLGFLFATLSMYGDYATLENPFVLFVPLFILAFPLIDTAYLIIIRITKGIVPLRKSNDHIFLHLLFSGKNIKSALFSVYFVTLLWGISGVSLVFSMNILFLTFLFLAALFSVRLVFIARGSS